MSHSCMLVSCLPPCVCVNLPPSPVPSLPPLLPAGYRVATLGSSLATCSDVSTVFDTCNSLDGALLVTEVDATCKVRVFVAGDAGCSGVNNLAVVEG